MTFVMRLIVGLVGLFLAGMGLVFLIHPAEMAAKISRQVFQFLNQFFVGKMFVHQVVHGVAHHDIGFVHAS